MSGQSLKSKVAKGAVWVLLEKLSVQAVGFVVSMVLARLLTPDDYGTVALVAIFFAVSNVLVDGGFGNALIQKKDADDLDFNSVFYINVLLSFLFYAILFFSADWIASFYDEPRLVAIVRVSGITLMFNAINAIQNAELTKKMLFHLSFRIAVLTSISSSVCGITLAFLGYGVWALVFATLVSGLIGVIARWFIIAWRPRRMFSFDRLRPLFAYGWKMAASALLDQFFVQLNGLLIGKFYTKADLAFVNKGNHLPQLAMCQIDETLGRVSFPALVQIQNDREKLRDAMRRMMQCSTFLVFPLMVFIGCSSTSIIRLLFGSQWLPAAPYMMLACFSFALWPFHTINLKGVMALGRSDIFLKLEIIKKLAKLIVILVAFRYGVFVFMAASAFALGPLSLLINAWPNKRLLNYTIRMQLRDVMPTILLCCVEAVIVISVGYSFCLVHNYAGLPASGTSYMLYLAAQLLVQALLGLTAFCALAYIFRLKPMKEYVAMGATAFQYRMPRLTQILKRRFES